VTASPPATSTRRYCQAPNTWGEWGKGCVCRTALQVSVSVSGGRRGGEKRHNISTMQPTNRVVLSANPIYCVPGAAPSVYLVNCTLRYKLPIALFADFLHTAGFVRYRYYSRMPVTAASGPTHSSIVHVMLCQAPPVPDGAEVAVAVLVGRSSMTAGSQLPSVIAYIQSPSCDHRRRHKHHPSHWHQPRQLPHSAHDRVPTPGFPGPIVIAYHASKATGVVLSCRVQGSKEHRRRSSHQPHHQVGTNHHELRCSVSPAPTPHPNSTPPYTRTRARVRVCAWEARRVRRPSAGRRPLLSRVRRRRPAMPPSCHRRRRAW